MQTPQIEVSKCCGALVYEDYKDNPRDHHDPIEIYTCSKCKCECEGFTRRQELERAILKSADLLEKGDYDPVEKLIKDAVQIRLTKYMGTDYFADTRFRIDKYFNSGGQVSTGWPQMD